jgi:hypothetical protein
MGGGRSFETLGDQSLRVIFKSLVLNSDPVREPVDALAVSRTAVSQHPKGAQGIRFGHRSRQMAPPQIYRVRPDGATGDARAPGPDAGDIAGTW